MTQFIKINAAGLAIIKKFEGCTLYAIHDVRGIPTIAFGHTGPDVHMGLTINQDRADELLEHDLMKFSIGVEALVTPAPANLNQRSAMVCLAFNIGLGDRHATRPEDRHGFAWSSILRYHKQGEFIRAADAFLLYNKSGGRYYEGLARRRAEERKLYLSPT